MNLEKKHALVTGGGSGVGAAIALSLAAHGACVTIVGRRDAPLKALSETHSNIHCAVADVTSVDELDAAFDSACEKFGPVSIAVANAGAAVSVPFLKMTADDLRNLLDVNLLGVFNTFKAAAPLMVDAGWGRLISIGSTAGLKGYRYVSHYCAAKHGVVGLTRSLALELASKGLTVNSVCPSYIDTEMTQRSIDNIVQKTGKTRQQAERILTMGNPLDRLITPEEVAATVLWLCSDSASAINGQAVPVAGGEL